jgi:hypothetical protein
VVDHGHRYLEVVTAMKISVLVPFGADDSPAGKQRAKVWRWNQRRWEAVHNAGLIDEVIIGVDPLFGKLRLGTGETDPFSVSRALNDAAKHARGDVFLLFGADHVPDPALITWARDRVAHHPWVRLHDHVLYASEAATRLMLAGDKLIYDAADWTRHPAPCPGVLALTRAAFETAGGMDERFQGWGYEDTEFLSRLTKLVPGGQHEPSGLPLRELFVPSSRDLGHNLDVFSGITQERGW